MRKLVDEWPRVVVLSVLALVAVTAILVLLATTVAGADRRPARRVARVEQAARAQARELVRVRRELTVTRGALGSAARRAETAERLGARRLGAARRWRVRALRAERRLSRARRGGT